MEILKMAEIDAHELFEDDSFDWKYCMNFATFHHADNDSCEFILYLSKDNEIFKETVENMKECGCSEEFMDTCMEVKNKNIEFILFYC